MSAGSYQTERGQDLVMVLPGKMISNSSIVKGSAILVIRDQIKQRPPFSNGFTLEAGNRQKIVVAVGESPIDTFLENHNCGLASLILLLPSAIKLTLSISSDLPNMHRLNCWLNMDVSPVLSQIIQK